MSQVTAPQMAALQSYVSALVRVMTGAHASHVDNLTLYLECKSKLEAAFGQELEPPYSRGVVTLQYEYVDLFSDRMPDLL